MRLCQFCIKRNGSDFPKCADSECELCKGASSKLGAMVTEAAAKIPKDWKSFAISTRMPPKMLASEEEAWDYGLGESIKNDFNSKIVSALIEKTGLDYDVLKSDGKIVFDFGKNDVWLEICDIFIFGRYKKFRGDLAQSTWTCRDCNGAGCKECGNKGVKYDSVESILCRAAGGIYGAKDAEMHSSGREDVDALNTAGRPFVLELRKPATGKCDLDLFSNSVNGAKEGVEVSDLKYVSNSNVALVSDSHFDKAYEAEIEMGNFAQEDLGKLLSLKGVVLEQRTPMRVAHRRSDLVRRRRILDLKIICEKPLRVWVLAEAGTYIKEFVSGDEGRTVPSIAQATGKNAKCIKLLVAQIDDDFLREIVG